VINEQTYETHIMHSLLFSGISFGKLSLNLLCRYIAN